MLSFSYVCGSNSTIMMLGKLEIKCAVFTFSLFWAVPYSTEHVCSWVLLILVVCPAFFEFTMYCLLFNCTEF